MEQALGGLCQCRAQPRLLAPAGKPAPGSQLRPHQARTRSRTWAQPCNAGPQLIAQNALPALSEHVWVGDLKDMTQVRACVLVRRRDTRKQIPGLSPSPERDGGRASRPASCTPLRNIPASVWLKTGTGVLRLVVPATTQNCGNITLDTVTMSLLISSPRQRTWNRVSPPEKLSRAWTRRLCPASTEPFSGPPDPGLSQSPPAPPAL